ncbi:MAG TPA: GGDEF domain-containing protein [Aquificaceae bacterium]|nr:GGDEF domain-containing protein [Aquificaceae bacterium]
MKRNMVIKVLLVISSAFLVILFTALYAFRSQGLEEAKQRAYMISELVRDTLTSYMIMGVMDRRDEFLGRIKEIKGVEEIRVVRGRAVVEQFGAGSKFEMPRDEIEKAVLESGKPMEVLDESLRSVKYRIVIPYKAEPIKGINCLECHKAKPGETLGAISLTMDLSHIKEKSLHIFLLTTTVFLLAFLGIFFFFNSFITKVSNFIKEIELTMRSASEGNFKTEIKTDLGYETRSLKESIEKSFYNLQNTLTSIEEKVRTMIGYGVIKTGNVLSDTSKIVDELLNIYKFKRVIEKDKSKKEVYERLREVLEDYMSLENFSIYEVDQNKNKISPVYVKGAKYWCNEVIFENAEECRAERTGMDVDSREFPCVCPNFIDNDVCKQGKMHYYCIPVYVGGMVGNVVQIVYEPEMEPFINLIIPYIKGYLNEASPVLEARTYMDMLREQSLRDQLTGLYNRRFLDETIDKIAAQIKRRGTTLGILMVDIDYFKEVNDTYGHDMGDKVLKEIAKVLVKSVREADLVIRFGGEEFLVLLMDVQSGKSVEIAEKIRKAVESHTIESFGVVLRKTVSVGVSEFPVDSDKIWQCIKYADVALYKAKEMGRNRVVRFKPEFWTENNY